MSKVRANSLEMLDGRGKGAIIFDSVSQMKGSTQIKTGQKVRTLGYDTPGDGGGNDYEIVAGATGTADGGSFIDLSGSGLQARGLFNEGVNVLQLGSPKVSGTNATPAFNKASSFGVKEIRIPPGNYDLQTAPTVADDVTWYVEKGAYFVGTYSLSDLSTNIVSMGFHAGIVGAKTASWIGESPQPGLGYIERNASLGAYASKGAIAVAGAAHTQEMTGGAAIGVAGVGYNDNTVNKVNTWGLYLDAKNASGALGTTWGTEIAVATLGTYVDWYSASDAKTYGIGLVAGADSAINGTTDSVTSAIYLSNNGANFGRGIVVNPGSLRQFTDSSSRNYFKAMVLRYSMQIEWEDNAGATLGFLRSSVSVPSASVGILLYNNNLIAEGASGEKILHFANVESAVNYPLIRNAATGGAVRISAIGSDANIDLSLEAKGTGHLKFGTRAAIGAETVTGYIEVKDAGGIIRKLAVVS